jgi:hypothetical protein
MAIDPNLPIAEAGTEKAVLDLAALALGAWDAGLSGASAG